MKGFICFTDIFIYKQFSCHEFIKVEAQYAESVSLTFHSGLRKLNRDPFIGASHQILVHLAKQFQRRRLLEINQSETKIACGGHIF